MSVIFSFCVQICFYLVFRRHFSVPVRYAAFTCVVAEDLKLNTTLFAWPQNIEAILELSNARITSRRERAEEELKARVAECEERLNELSKEIDVFRRKEVRLIKCLYRHLHSFKDSF